MKNQQPPTSGANDPSRPPRILIVDDDALNLKLFTISLSKRGYRVLLAMDGRFALDLAQRERPDLVIMDVQLPDMSGLEATRMLKSDDTTRDIPVLITTAFLIDGDELRDSGCDAYLAKPYPAEKLIEIIVSLMHTPAPAPVN
jgi:two-component system cell cycle response regulator DivK